MFESNRMLLSEFLAHALHLFFSEAALRVMYASLKMVGPYWEEELGMV